MSDQPANVKPRVWKGILGSEETHQVSSDGLVRSWLNRGGIGSRNRRRATPRLLSQCLRKGYPSVNFWNRSEYVHHLVLDAFVGPRKPGQECAHNNGNPTDNRIENLRWATKVENAADRKIHGTVADQSGEKNGNAKLTTKQVKEIKRDRRSVNEIAQDYGVSWQTIGDIKKGLKWKNV
jgi:hypothetical protein